MSVPQPAAEDWEGRLEATLRRKGALGRYLGFFKVFSSPAIGWMATALVVSLWLWVRAPTDIRYDEKVVEQIVDLQHHGDIWMLRMQRLLPEKSGGQGDLAASYEANQDMYDSLSSS